MMHDNITNEYSSWEAWQIDTPWEHHKLIPQTVKLNFTTPSDNKDKSNMFTAHFHSSFSLCHNKDETFLPIHFKHNHKLSDVTCSAQEVYTLLSW